MKLEGGQFVRFKDKRGNTYIRNIKEVCNEQPHKSWGAIIIDKNANNVPYVSLKNIIKASYNIIDILECGDIIKLFMEDDIDGEDTNIFELIAINYNDNEIGVFNSDFQIEFFPIENLRGILTHEQMEQMTYKVGN